MIEVSEEAINGMDDEKITIDFDELRNDLRSECIGVFLDGGFGGALIESFDIDRASPEELVEFAQRQEIDLRKYWV